MHSVDLLPLYFKIGNYFSDLKINHQALRELDRFNTLLKLGLTKATNHGQHLVIY